MSRRKTRCDHAPATGVKRREPPGRSKAAATAAIEGSDSLDRSAASSVTGATVSREVDGAENQKPSGVAERYDVCTSTASGSDHRAVRSSTSRSPASARALTSSNATRLALVQRSPNHARRDRWRADGYRDDGQLAVGLDPSRCQAPSSPFPDDRARGAALRCGELTGGRPAHRHRVQRRAHPVASASAHQCAARRTIRGRRPAAASRSSTPCPAPGRSPRRA